jgi:hypothetical protein
MTARSFTAVCTCAAGQSQLRKVLLRAGSMAAGAYHCPVAAGAMHQAAAAAAAVAVAAGAPHHRWHLACTPVPLLRC